jgi:lipoprotein-anchoring transpeptidase ErfK/SrfK
MRRVAPVLIVLLAAAAARALDGSPARADEPAAQVQPKRTSYRLEPVNAARMAKQYSPWQIALLETLNRRDVERLARLNRMIVPDAWPDDELALGVLPAAWASAESRAKVIVVSQPAQLFGAYEFGKLVRWGPVSSGREDTPTPAGVYNLTWKARSRRSTDNADWLLNWNFNFINARGVSFHQFELPGFAASHACVRLLERDAMWLYAWGEQWTLSPNGRDVTRPGTTVVVLGDFGHGKPGHWRSLEWWRRLPIELPIRTLD